MFYDENSNIVRITDDETRVYTFEYDRSNRLVRSVDPLGGVTKYTYDVAGNVLVERISMNNNKNYSTELADIITKNFSINQMKRYVYFDKIPRLIFHLKKNGQELEEYKKMDEILRKFKVNLEWGVLQCPRSKVNYMILPLKREEIERGNDFKGEEYLKGDIKYTNLLKLATLDYSLLIDYLKSGAYNQR